MPVIDPELRSAMERYSDNDRIDIPFYGSASEACTTREITPNITQVNADQVWALGYTGQGVVVGMVAVGAVPAWNDAAEIQDVGVLVFPNPSKDGFNVQCEGLTNIEVFSMDGKMIMSIAPTGTQCFINGLNSGMYLLRIVSSQGLTFRKIVKF